ncbi:transcriptional regulator BetI [Marinobacter sp. M3C]|uniref:transcriptional regulator BetI n=1 Tax=unclassified Marinobacter TaxID=83889 RepID=UPI00200D0F7F|nr:MULTISPECIES: transcriptional regulator BetI [unclassified Marinobacter]MCL1485279.1 transcriptional regulator BetI [Marinobacter sp.]UQG55069.1 transcriptional regulator BetI [Marinobacter sp. M4C]UQG59581.1 transcriptional regulator BetI [Marinobacter sp. M3C]UQG63870.1 transcriptional regulator BetI [Marinobacter sp. M2C]UQG68153.1 transcriptional regulator BetI [Marinobacter sp. M1C]
MAKIGVKDTRKQQLIKATMESIAELGMQNTTIISISKRAGMSSGIISHYFGGKQGLIEAALRYLLDQLGKELRERMAKTDGSPEQRLDCIVDSNFSNFQRSALAAKTWLSFWSRSMHEPGLQRLQQINNARLYSNLRYSFAQVMEPTAATEVARQTAAMIDGFWLRSALSLDPQESFEAGERLCKRFIRDTLARPQATFSSRIV